MMVNFNLLILGDSGWGDELLIASVMTILVSISAMTLGLFIADNLVLYKLSGVKGFLRSISELSA